MNTMSWLSNGAALHRASMHFMSHFLWLTHCNLVITALHKQEQTSNGNLSHWHHQWRLPLSLRIMNTGVYIRLWGMHGWRWPYGRNMYHGSITTTSIYIYMQYSRSLMIAKILYIELYVLLDMQHLYSQKVSFQSLHDAASRWRASASSLMWWKQTLRDVCVPLFCLPGENVAYGFSTPSAVHEGWMNSPGHRANILNGNFVQMGLATATGSNGYLYWTQVFARPLWDTPPAWTKEQWHHQVSIRCVRRWHQKICKLKQTLSLLLHVSRLVGGPTYISTSNQVLKVI